MTVLRKCYHLSYCLCFPCTPV